MGDATGANDRSNKKAQKNLANQPQSSNSENPHRLHNLAVYRSGCPRSSSECHEIIPAITADARTCCKRPRRLCREYRNRLNRNVVFADSPKEGFDETLTRIGGEILNEKVANRTMPHHRVIKQKTATANKVDPQWSRWLQMARQVPDIRADKVNRTRRLLVDANLDGDDVLDITVNRLLNELGVLFRKPDDNTPTA